MKQSDIICSNINAAFNQSDTSAFEGWGRCRKLIDPNSKEYADALRQLIYIKGIDNAKSMLRSAQSSSLTSFYTPTDVAQTITEYALTAYKELNGREPIQILDPSCGTGAFVSNIDTSKYQVTACEKDEITRIVLTKRMGNSITIVPSYEIVSHLAHFDIITSNIPFGDVSVYDKALDKMGGVYKASQKKIHNYYFMKSLHLLNDGGIMAFITSRGFLSSEKNKPFREEMLKHGTILNIIRLPDNLFPTVEVGSDLIVYYKGHIKDNEVMEYLFFGGWAEDEEDAFHLSCEIKTKKNQYGKNVIHYKYTGTDMANSLSRLLRIGLSCHLNSSATLTTAQGSGRATIKVAEDHFTDSGKMLHYGSRFFFFFDKFENEE